MFESTGLFLLWLISTYIIANIFIGIRDGLAETNDELHRQLIKRLDEIVHRVEVEQQGDTYYWFDQDNRKFLAQGRTTEEIIGTLKTRFPDHIFYIEKSKHLICAKHGWEPQPVKTDKL